MTPYHHLIIDDTLYTEMHSYAEQHDLSISDVIASAWRLYRDMSAMRDDAYNVPQATLARYQQDTAIIEQCLYCNQHHPKGTIEQCPLNPNKV